VEETLDMTLLEIITYLYSGGLDLMTEFFKSHKYNMKVEEFEDDDLQYIITVKYIDNINHLWKPRWAREARGRGYAIGRNGDVYEIKNSLMRGAELLTRAHLQDGVVETQDVPTQDNWKFDTLDEYQQTIMKTFNLKENIDLKDAYVTQKVDGSLLVVSYYPVDTPEYILMNRFIAHTGHYHMRTETGLYIPSTSGNVYMSDPMKDYFVTATAAFCGIKIKHRTSDQIWDNIKDVFTHKLAQLTTNNQVSSFVFEMVCENRNTHENKVHTEHTISYPFSDLFFLGTCRGRDYIPHYKQDVDISQPAWCRVESTGDAIQIMRDIERTIKQEMTPSDLNGKWFNKARADDIVHPEGLVYLDHYICASPTEPTYSKIKLPIYYKCHKFERYSLTDILAFPTTTDAHFPMIGRLRWYTDNISTAIATHTSNLKELVETELTTSSVSYRNAPTKAKKRFDAYAEAGTQQDKDILCKMITSTIDKDEQMRRTIIDMTKSAFKIENDTKDDELTKISKSLLMKMAPWRPGYEERLSVIVGQDKDKNQLINQIYKAVMYN
jgi:hypothetical protein